MKGCAHITGGGFVENIPRMLPAGVSANIQLGSWPILPIFDCLQSYGKLSSPEMYEIFNMGIGMVVAVSPEKVAEVTAAFAEQGETFTKSVKLSQKTHRKLFSLEKRHEVSHFCFG